MAYWSFVTLAKEAKANIKLRKTALPLFLTRNMGLDSKTCMIIYGVTVIATLVLEHCFTIAKILGSIIGCLVVAFLCYELSDVTPMNTRLIITGVGTVITILLNIRFWRR